MIGRETIDIVIFALSRFDGPYSSSPISLAKEFSKTNRVFYINHPYSIKDIFVGFKSRQIAKRLSPLLLGKNSFREVRINDQGNSLTMVTTPVTLPLNFLPDGNLYRFLRKYNEWVFFHSLRKLIRQKKIKDFIFLNAFDPYFGLTFPGDIKPLMKIYYCMDDMEEAEYTQKHGRRLEKKLMQEYDITLTTSEELFKNNKPFARYSRCLPNAADPSLFGQAYFKKLDQPNEFTGVTKKVIGFIGNIEQRMDYDLVKKVADFHNDKLLYLVGPTSSDEYKREGLDKIGNIVFTGGKNINELPAYLQNIDCAIIPFRCNKLTKSIYPLKINEYLSGGKPVVTTNFSDSIREFQEVVYVASDHDQFVRLINKAINENTESLAHARIEFAAKNSWEARITDFWNIVEDYRSENV